MSRSLTIDSTLNGGALAEREDTATTATESYSSFSSSLRRGDQGASDERQSDVQNRHARPFPKPATGHICVRCQGIPLEIFQIGSNFFSNRCKTRHPPDKNCNGKHDIRCNDCGQTIQESFYHCGLCNDENFDLCQDCMDKGQNCQEPEHKLTKRIFDGGIVREVDEDDESYHHPGVHRAMIPKGLEPYRLHNTLSDLLASAESGCHSCSLLVGRLGWVAIEETAKDVPVFIENRPLVVPEDFKFVAYMQRQILEEPNIEDETTDEGMPAVMLAVRTERDPVEPVYVDPEKDRIVRWLPFEVRVSDRIIRSREAGWITGTERLQIAPAADAGENLKVIKDWLASCLKEESECSVWPKDVFMPTRLVYVGSGDDESNPLRLVWGKDIEEDAPVYATLSYCWGVTGQQSRWITTIERLPDFQRRIPLAVLPQTIADAVKVLREVGIRYLWVDSLCIVQDDPWDWAHEAFLMGRVYNSSLFTIISGVDSATGGLFLPRDPLRVSAAEILLASSACPGLNTLTLYPILEDIGTIHLSGPTKHRAWCYQEELLSPRRLYFTKGQFVWECLCSQHDEIGRRYPGDTKQTGYVPPPYHADILLRKSRVVGEWHGVVEEYTSRRLTYHTDIFAALAGIAASLKARYGCRYFAGLWEDDMLNGLLWQRIGPSLARPSDLHVPSWSWFSVQGQVLYTRGSRTPSHPDAEFLDCDVKTVAGGEFTMVESGTLRIRARLLACEVAPEAEGKELDRLENINQQLPQDLTPFPSRQHQSSQRSDDEVQNETESSDDENEEGSVDENAAGSSEESDEEGDEEKSPFFLRSQPCETQNRFQVAPPGGRMDMTASVKLRGPEGRPFATVFFDGEPEAKCSEFFCAYIAGTERPENVVDRNGIALVPTEPSEDGSVSYNRIGFIAFWDKLIKNDLGFLDSVAKTEIVLV